jgi:hypothetical protein
MSKKYIIHFYKNVHNQSDDLCLSKFRMTQEQYDEYFTSRGNTLLLSAMKTGKKIPQITETFLGYVGIFMSRRYDKKRVKRADHEIFATSFYPNMHPETRSVKAAFRLERQLQR